MPREFGDPYLYPGTRTLRNLPGLRNEEALKQFEYEQSASRIAELREQPPSGRYGMERLKEVHAYLFQDVYDWSGEVRSVGISKGNTQFAQPAFIESEGKRLSAELAKENHLKGLDKPQFVNRLAHHFAEWNALHPFREGNGRATREFFGELARAAGYELDQSAIDNSQGQWNHAAQRSFNGDLKPLQEVFERAVVPLRSLQKNDRREHASSPLHAALEPRAPIRPERAGQDEGRPAYSPRNVREALDQLPSNLAALASDTRYGDHTREERGAVGFYKGLAQSMAHDAGREFDDSRFDATMADRAAAARLPVPPSVLPDINHALDAEPPSKAQDRGSDMDHSH
jgi:cell filamentation protein